MLLVESLVFRKLTSADYFNINKPPGMEDGGGGQSYIDISTSAVTLANWDEFLRDVPKSMRTSGPRWTVPVRSLGVSSEIQDVIIGQRRNTSVSIREQKLLSRSSNRVNAWNPNLTGFPKPKDPTVLEDIGDLCVYIVKLTNGELWAGWFQNMVPEPGWSVNDKLYNMFSDNEGYIKFSGNVCFKTGTPSWPFKLSSVSTTIEDENYAGEDILFADDEINPDDISSTAEKKIVEVRMRNTKAVRVLKKLYRNRCQISGEIYTFKKRNGELYSEGHHLIPLGEGGADSAYNIVVLSPLIHRMLHYAEVEGLNLKEIRDNKLTIKINGEDYTITWHPDHAKKVMSYA